MDIFFEENDRIVYLSLLKEQGNRVGLEYVGYCLMFVLTNIFFDQFFEDCMVFLAKKNGCQPLPRNTTW